MSTLPPLDALDLSQAHARLGLKMPLDEALQCPPLAACIRAKAHHTAWLRKRREARLVDHKTLVAEGSTQ